MKNANQEIQTVQSKSWVKLIWFSQNAVLTLKFSMYKKEKLTVFSYIAEKLKRKEKL
jgi:hypothetical protein